nr:NYN domain-containing protein [Candidatus Moranbacteria bacterium]
MAKFADQRVGVLVDVSNLYHSARVLYRKKVNYKNVLESAVSGRKLIRAIAYGITTTEGMEEKFLETLKTYGYDVKTKDLQIFPDGSKKGDWDVAIAIDAIKMAPKLDVVVIISEIAIIEIENVITEIEIESVITEIEIENVIIEIEIE